MRNKNLLLFLFIILIIVSLSFDYINKLKIKNLETKNLDSNNLEIEHFQDSNIWDDIINNIDTDKFSEIYPILEQYNNFIKAKRISQQVNIDKFKDFVDKLKDIDEDKKMEFKIEIGKVLSAHQDLVKWSDIIEYMNKNIYESTYRAIIEYVRTLSKREDSVFYTDKFKSFIDENLDDYDDNIKIKNDIDEIKNDYDKYKQDIVNNKCMYWKDVENDDNVPKILRDGLKNYLKDNTDDRYSNECLNMASLNLEDLDKEIQEENEYYKEYAEKIEKNNIAITEYKKENEDKLKTNTLQVMVKKNTITKKQEEITKNENNINDKRTMLVNLIAQGININTNTNGPFEIQKQTLQNEIDSLKRNNITIQNEINTLQNDISKIENKNELTVIQEEKKINKIILNEEVQKKSDIEIINEKDPDILKLQNENKVYINEMNNIKKSFNDRKENLQLLRNLKNAPFCYTKGNEFKKCEIKGTTNTVDIRNKRGSFDDVFHSQDSNIINKNFNSSKNKKQCVAWNIGNGGRDKDKIDIEYRNKFKNVKGEYIKEPSKHAFCAKLRSGQPWCYTDPNSSKKHYCCPDGQNCNTYIGTKCLKWNKTIKGKEKYKNTRNHSDWSNRKDILGNNIISYDTNMCINPDNDSGGDWCYTSSGSDGDWQYCNKYGGKYTKRGKKYYYPLKKAKGKKETVRGSTCKKWSGTSKGRKKYDKYINYSQWFPTKGNDTYDNYNSNICLNPDNDKRDWCYTWGGAWDYCSGKSKYYKPPKKKWHNVFLSWFNI